MNVLKWLRAGRYYDFDTSQNGHHDSIMADQLAGHWFMKASQLEDDTVSKSETEWDPEPMCRIQK